MKREQVLNQLTTPIGAPAFPRGPFRFTNREYLNILYRTDIDGSVRIDAAPGGLQVRTGA